MNKRLLLVDPNSVDAVERGKAAALARRGWNVTVLAPQAFREGLSLLQASPLEPGAPYRLLTGTVRGKPPNRCVFTDTLIAALRERPDVVHVLSDENFALTLQVLALAKALCPDALRIAHSWQNILCDRRRHGQPLLALYAFDTLVEKAVFGLADGLVARNEEAVEVLKARGFHGPVAHVPWGVDVEAVRAKAAAARAALPERLEGPVIGYVGRLVPEKDVATLVEAMALLERGTAVVVGDGPERARLQRLAQERGVTGRVHFVGAQPRADVGAWMRAFDLLVLPSRETAGWKEQFGRVLVEAMALGVPCVGSRSGAIPAVIGEAGTTFEPGDAAGLASALRVALEERERLSHIARVRAELFSWDRFAERTDAFIGSLGSRA